MKCTKSEPAGMKIEPARYRNALVLAAISLVNNMSVYVFGVFTSGRATNRPSAIIKITLTFGMFTVYSSTHFINITQFVTLL